jgi:hypothetical protein
MNGSALKTSSGSLRLAGKRSANKARFGPIIPHRFLNSVIESLRLLEARSGQNGPRRSFLFVSCFGIGATSERRSGSTRLDPTEEKREASHCPGPQNHSCLRGSV